METNRNLTCILFPGIVKNEDKALELLGGIRNISQVHSLSNKKRLGLSFHPDNPYAKRIFADCVSTSGFLIKVRVLKTKVGNEFKRNIMSSDVLGRVKTIYKFESLCDFQYLPVTSETQNEKPTCILEQMLPTGIHSFDWLREPAPLLIAPCTFTRTDRPMDCFYSGKKYGCKVLEPTDDDTHQKLREERGISYPRYSFNLIDDIPTEPHQASIDAKNARLVINPELEDEMENVKKLFEERPIWSSNAVKFLTKIKRISLKVILPCLAVYMREGPWRMLWVKFGYDPRKDPGAGMYQSLDFRLRSDAGVNSMVLSQKQINMYKTVDRVRQSFKSNREDNEAGEEQVAESVVYFRPGMVLVKRQTFYQYCDVKIPEVQELLSRVAEPAPGALCHERRGWFPPGVDAACRDHLFNYAKQALLTTHKDLKVEQGGSSEEEDDSNAEDTGVIDEIADPNVQ